MATQKALIVDDSRTAQIKLQRMLRPYPLEIVTADSAEEALLYLRRQHPAVIFMDHSMPGMDGLEALKIIRSDPKTSALPVIMYTAQQGDVYVGRAQEAGANDVLSKDVMDDQGLEKVLRFLRFQPRERPARRQNVTSISDRLAQPSGRFDESMALAKALSGRAFSRTTLDENKEPGADTATPAPADPVINESAGAAPSAEAPLKVADSNPEGLRGEAEPSGAVTWESQPPQPRYHSLPPRHQVADNERAKPVWPSVLVIGVLLFIAYQLVEIRNDQNELDRMLRDIQTQMDTE